MFFSHFKFEVPVQVFEIDVDSSFEYVHACAGYRLFTLKIEKTKKPYEMTRSRKSKEIQTNEMLHTRAHTHKKKTKE